MGKEIRKDITIQDLALMVANGFSGMDKKFIEGFDEVNTRLNRVDESINKLANTTFNIDSKLRDVDVRLKRVEEALDPLPLGYKIIQREIKNINQRIELLEEKTGIAA